MQKKSENQSKDEIQVNVEKLTFDINGNETALEGFNENEKPQNIWHIEPAAGDYEIQENSGLNPLYLNVQFIETILNVKSIISSQFAADEAAVALQDRSNSSQETEIPFQISRKAETISITFENEDDTVVEGNTNQPIPVPSPVLDIEEEMSNNAEQEDNIGNTETDTSPPNTNTETETEAPVINESETINGTKNNDIIHSNEGDDILLGLKGDDTLNFYTSDKIVNGGNGFDKAVLQDEGSITLEKNTFKNIEYIDTKNGLENTITLDIKDILKLSNTDEIFIEADEYDIINVQNIEKSNYDGIHFEHGMQFSHYSLGKADLYIDISLALQIGDVA
jgi:Ca2+-binding RTX toxin-like protein